MAEQPQEANPAPLAQIIQGWSQATNKIYKSLYVPGMLLALILGAVSGGLKFGEVRADAIIAIDIAIGIIYMLIMLGSAVWRQPEKTKQYALYRITLPSLAILGVSATYAIFALSATWIGAFHFSVHLNGFLALLGTLMMYLETRQRYERNLNKWKRALQNLQKAPEQ